MGFRSSTTRLVVAAIVAAFLLAACGAGSSAQPRLSVPADTILDFSGRTLDGPTLDVSTLADKPTVFWFWAPWCSVCRREAPGVERVAEKYADQVNFVGIPGLGEVDAMKQFVSDTGTTSLVHVVDGNGSLWKRFGVTAQPAYVFVAPDGKVSTVAGGMKEAAFDKAVADLLAN